jgi:hypothetical protein
MSQMADPPTPAADDQLRRYLSPQDFSRLSGLSLATVHRYLKTGKLAYRQPGGRRGRILILAEVLEATHGADVEPDASTAVTVEPQSTAPATRLSGPRPRWARQAGRPKPRRTE